MRTKHKSGCQSNVLEQLETRCLMSASIIYVDANIASDSHSTVHNGSSWANAYQNLQSALTQAASTTVAEQIWIAKGTYKPSQIYSPLNAAGKPVVGGYSKLNTSNLKTFNLPNNVTLHGGFSYGAASLAAARPSVNLTILSGDLAGNDSDAANPSAGEAKKSDNAWHVVTLGDDVTDTGVTATLTGLTIVDGYANGADVGGTLSPFIDGNADGGGVTSTFHSNLVINDCTFKYNYAASDGGGVFSDGSNLTAINSTFLHNDAVTRAGGLEGLNDFENGFSHVSLVQNDLFEDNTCQVFGGALVGEGSAQGANSMMTIEGSTFIRNQAPEGGAVVFDTEKVTINDSTFTYNTASVDGGALSTTNIVGTLTGQKNNYATTVTNSTFTGNVCLGSQTAHDTFFPFPGISFSKGGGALDCYMNGFLNVDSCLFASNSTQAGDGGAILNGDSSYAGLSVYSVHTTVTNSAFIDNSARTGSGGAIASEIDHLVPAESASGTVLTVNNSDFVSNSATQGGAVYLDTSKASLANNSFLFDSSANGSGLYAKASTVNALASTSSTASKVLEETNAYVHDTIVLK